MELASKDAEIEQLQLKLAALNSETASLSSADNEGLFFRVFFSNIVKFMFKF